LTADGSSEVGRDRRLVAFNGVRSGDQLIRF
jgi:hypothetical protein